jgi:hypothetical protein
LRRADDRPVSRAPRGHRGRAAVGDIAVRVGDVIAAPSTRAIVPNACRGACRTRAGCAMRASTRSAPQPWCTQASWQRRVRSSGAAPGVRSRRLRGTIVIGTRSCVAAFTLGFAFTADIYQQHR